MFLDSDPGRSLGRTDLKREYTLKTVVALARTQHGGYTRFMLTAEKPQ